MISNDTNSVFNSSSDLLDAYIDSGVGIIHLKDKIFEMAVDLSLRQILFERLEIANKSNDIKVILLISDDSVMGEEKNDQFWRMVGNFYEGKDTNKYNLDCTSAEMVVSRKENTINQFVRFSLVHKKFIITSLQGSVVTPFFGAALACDYRIVSENTIFSFPHFKYRLPPRGALAYFLPRYIGYGEARSILLKGKSINAREAKEMKLVDEVLPTASFKESCLDIAKEFTNIPIEIIGMTKALFAADLESIEKHLQKEIQLIRLAHDVMISGKQNQ